VCTGCARRPAEAFVAGLVEDLRDDWAKMFKAVGEMPSAEASDATWEEYCERIEAWQNKQRG
jgi:hypothetical protein